MAKASEALTHALVNCRYPEDEVMLRAACDSYVTEGIAQKWGYVATEQVTCMECIVATAGCRGHDTLEALLAHEREVDTELSDEEGR